MQPPSRQEGLGLGAPLKGQKAHGPAVVREKLLKHVGLAALFFRSCQLQETLEFRRNSKADWNSGGVVHRERCIERYDTSSHMCTRMASHVRGFEKARDLRLRLRHMRAPRTGGTSTRARAANRIRELVPKDR